MDIDWYLFHLDHWSSKVGILGYVHEVEDADEREDEPDYGSLAAADDRLNEVQQIGCEHFQDVGLCVGELVHSLNILKKPGTCVVLKSIIAKLFRSLPAEKFLPRA
jgi:hypothetical protein